jgi:Flp pilus assembly protein TadG
MMTNPRRNREKGQTLIEFAFVMPIILVLLLTIVDFGIALDRREVIQHAVREGARQGAVGLSEAQVQTETANQSEGVLDPGDVTVCYVAGSGGSPIAGRAGSNIRVRADFTYRFTVGAGELLTAFGVDPDSLAIPMTPSAEARLETSVTGAVAC